MRREPGSRATSSVPMRDDVTDEPLTSSRDLSLSEQAEGPPVARLWRPRRPRPGRAWLPHVAAFAAHSRGGWRALRPGAPGVPGDEQGVLAPGVAATYAVWQAGDLVVQTPDSRVAAWSTDERAGVPGLPDLTPGEPTPACLRTAVRGRVVHELLAG